VLALVLDTSSAAVTAAVVEFGEDAAAPAVRAQRVIVDARAHGEQLTPSIQACLVESGCRVAELSAVVAGLGPGPFTGLRVGLVTAAVLADALGLPTYGVCSLDAIAATLAGQEDLLVAGDARRKEIYWARYRHGRRLDEPAVGKPAEVRAELPTAATVMAGAGARLYADVLDLPLLDSDYPTPAGLAACAADRVLSRAAGERLNPLYLRRPDAVAPTARKPVTS
jgi:tRNA threonylcarbamoyl adenosine modification protein YeaZ